MLWKVCNQAIELSNYYKLINNTNSSRTVKIKCGQSEMFKYDDTFMNKYKSFLIQLYGVHPILIWKYTKVKTINCIIPYLFRLVELNILKRQC